MGQDNLPFFTNEKKTKLTYEQRDNDTTGNTKICSP